MDDMPTPSIWRMDGLYIQSMLQHDPIPIAHPQTPENERLIQLVMQLGAGSYYHVRMLADETVVAIGPLVFTTAIYIDADATGFAKRFCFDDYEKAYEQYAKLTTGDDEPVGYIASRPERISEQSA